MQQNLGYLFAAFAITWVALFGYLFVIQRMLNETSRRLRGLERESNAEILARTHPKEAV